MDFLKLLTRILVKKATDLYTNKPGEQRSSVPRCESCGRYVSKEALVDGKCPICRLAEQREQSQRNQQETKSSDAVNLEEAYKIFECTAADSDETIKKRYRELVKECHVDSLPKELPDYLVKAANKRFHQIRESYEKIMASRGAS